VRRHAVGARKGIREAGAGDERVHQRLECGAVFAQAFDEQAGLPVGHVDAVGFAGVLGPDEMEADEIVRGRTWRYDDAPTIDAGGHLRRRRGERKYPSSQA
jgi:hypothetical protein